MSKQLGLDGNIVKETPNEEEKSKTERAQIAIWKSALQKAIRRGQTDKAMFYADELCKVDSWSLWRRLSIIACEDIGQPNEIVAVDVLFRQFLAQKRENSEKTPDENMRRTAVVAAKILAECPNKDRRADEFLELRALADKQEPEAVAYVAELAKIDDWVYDQHTWEGKRLGRGIRYFEEVSSKVDKPSPAYQESIDGGVKKLLKKIYKKMAEEQGKEDIYI